MEHTKEELAVIECLKKGLSNAEAALVIGKCSNTVKYHLGKVYKKYGVANRFQFLAKLIK